MECTNAVKILKQERISNIFHKIGNDCNLFTLWILLWKLPHGKNVKGLQNNKERCIPLYNKGQCSKFADLLCNKK